jgi:hypothetical protein
VDAALAGKTGKANVFPPVNSTDTQTDIEQVASTEPATGNEQRSTDRATSAKDVTETVEADEASAKPAGRPATPRPMVRGSLGVGEQLSDLPHRGNGGRPTSWTTADGDGAATARPSSATVSSASSSSKGSSSRGDSADGDADNS